MSKQPLEDTAQRWANAAASSRLEENAVHSLIPPVVMNRREDEEWGAYVLIPINQDTIPYHVRKEYTRLLHAIISPRTHHTTRSSSAPVFHFSLLPFTTLLPSSVPHPDVVSQTFTHIPSPSHYL